MQFTTGVSPHLSPQGDITTLMLHVILALIPGILAIIWYFGWGIVINMLIATAVAVACEAAILTLRGRPVKPTLNDLSAVVTGFLLAMALPPLTPWWITLIGAAFAIIIAKQLYGGIGYNPFNPAMAGYVVLLIAFPQAMTIWLPPSLLSTHQPGLWEVLTSIFTGDLPASLRIDELTMATPLDVMKIRLGLDETIGEIRASPLFGDFGGKGWEWVNNWFLVGGVWLLYKRVITWHIPAAMLGALLLMALFFYLVDPDGYPFALFHIFSGGAIIGAFFVATDPVSAATTDKGKLIFGAGIGILVYVIRTWGGYPDGVAFAVLLMNMAVPTIDYYTQPRVYGRPKE